MTLVKARQLTAKKQQDLFLKYHQREDNLHVFLSKSKQIPGIPLAVKDNIMVKGLACTAGSEILKDYIGPYDATVVKRLKKAGFGILGKTNLDEFAMGSSTEHSAFGPTYNTHDPGPVPGGSSGGSAAAVAGDLCLAALGSDTGGSIRQPASFCGVVGFKPTYGAVSRYGLIAMASSLDQVGTLTKTVSDTKVLYDLIKGRDRLDSTSVKLPDSNPVEKPLTKTIRLGLPKQYFAKGLDKQVERVIKDAIKSIKGAGFKIKRVSLPSNLYALAAYYLIMPAEASSNLARFDGIRYGKGRNKFGPEVKRRILLGTYILSEGYYDAYYKRAQKTRNLIRQDFMKVFRKVDVLLTPTTPTTAFGLGEKVEDPLTMYLSDIYTVSVNLAGLPAISIPAGLAAGLPVGLQLIGKHFDDDNLLNLANEFERILE